MVSMNMRSRNPFLVIVWSIGLFVLMQVWQFGGMKVVALLNGIPFDMVMSGKVVTAPILFERGLAALLLGVPLIFLIVKYLWRRPFSWMNFHFNGTKAFLGLSAGIILPLFIVGALLFFGNASIAQMPSRFSIIDTAGIVFGALAFMLFVAISEELVFRAMIFREMAVKWNWIVASVVGGIIFGLLHFPNISSNSLVVDFAMIIFAAIAVSMMFTAMYVRFQSLWVPIGFHAGWNFCLDAVIRTTISGRDSTFGLFNFHMSGSTLITGGEFGIESSIVSITIYSAIAFYFFKKTTNKSLSQNNDSNLA